MWDWDLGAGTARQTGLASGCLVSDALVSSLSPDASTIMINDLELGRARARACTG